MPRKCKYEGKGTGARFDLILVAICRACALARSFGEPWVLFILAGKSFSEMFTTYSHGRYSRPRQRA
jgi:hypothetical protein